MSRAGLVAGIGGGVAAWLVAAKLMDAWPFTPPDEVVYTCPTCGATFSTLAALNAHIAAAHPGTQTYHSLMIEVLGRARAGAYEVARYPIDGATVVLSGPQSGQKVTTGGSVDWASLLDGTYSVTITHPKFATLPCEVALHSDLIATFQLQGGPIEPTLLSSYVPADGYFGIRLLHHLILMPQAPVKGYGLLVNADDPGWGPHHVDAYVFETDELEVMAPGDPRIKSEYTRSTLYETVVREVNEDTYNATPLGTCGPYGGLDKLYLVVNKFTLPFGRYFLIEQHFNAGAIFFNSITGVVYLLPLFIIPFGIIRGIGKFLQVSIRGEEDIGGVKITKWSHLIHEILRGV